MRAVLQAWEDLFRLAPFQNQGDGRALCLFGFVGAAVGGEVLVQALGLPLPGALVGALLLLVGLLLLGRLPKALEQTSGALLQNLMLLFIPIVAGVMLHFERIASEWLPFLASGIGGAVLTLLVTAAVFRWLLQRSGQKTEVEAEAAEPKA